MRRAILLLGCVGMAMTAPSRVRAGTEVEGDGFVGTSGGNWACGPVARVNYAGGGGRVRVTEERAPLGGKGAIAEVAGAAVSEANHFLHCPDAGCGDTDHVMPPARVMGAGHARIGYQWSRIGVEGGAAVFEAWKENTDSAPAVHVIPDVQLSSRSEDVKVMLGFGSPTVTTLARPGLYAGAGVPVSIVEIEIYGGAFRSGPSTAPGFRADMAAVVAVTPALKLRVGASVGEQSDVAGAEGSAGLVTDL